jgi:hypothetical protein
LQSARLVAVVAELRPLPNTLKILSFFFPAHCNRFVLGVAVCWAAWLALFFSYAARERLRIGHWPYFLDPQTLGVSPFPTHDALVRYGLLVVFALTVIWSVAVVIQVIAGRPRQPLQALGALCIGWLPLLFGVLFAPRGVFEWYFD